MITAAWIVLNANDKSRRNAAAATLSTLFFIEAFAQSEEYNGIMWLTGFPDDAANAQPLIENAAAANEALKRLWALHNNVSAKPKTGARRTTLKLGAEVPVLWPRRHKDFSGNKTGKMVARH